MDKQEYKMPPFVVIGIVATFAVVIVGLTVLTIVFLRPTEPANETSQSETTQTETLQTEITQTSLEGESKGANDYRMITMSEAKELFAKGGDYIIVDVRREDEFAGGHIPGAINIPNETITEDVMQDLPDKEAAIYIYCRSGNRSKLASRKLVNMGYTNVVEFGGILDWTGEISYE